MRAVELSGVCFSYDGRANVLKNANFFADFGEVALISGHSGNGKSTLLSVICGIIPHVKEGRLSGEVRICGESTEGKKLGQICRKVGVVLQNADEQIIQKIVEDEIAFGCENLAFAPEKIRAQVDLVCKLMKLDKTWNTRTLSGGQKQRLITASTIAMGQKIIILDEPLANLDKEGADLLMSTLRSLSRAGYCVIVVEHRLDTVLPYVDRVWHIEGGSVRAVEDTRSYLAEQSLVIQDNCAPYDGGEVLFDVSGVNYFVKGREILSGVDCKILKGERVVLLGENGCGKTTLLRLIARLNKPTAGSITQSIDAKLKQKSRGSRAWFKRVGVVYQNPDYQLFMPTVRQELCFNAASEEYAEEVARLFDVYGLWDRHPHSLSEGQKRRVSIAAVAAGKPEVLLLDEPTVGQDYGRLKMMTRVLNELHEACNNTMITVTHDLRCAEALCDRAMLIHGGTVAKTGGKELCHEYFFGEEAAQKSKSA